MLLKVGALIPAIGVCLDADIPVYIEGAPGVGKSEIVAEIAKARGALLIDIRLSMFDPVDLRGIPANVEGRTVWLRPGIWPTAADRETIILFDEMDRAAPAVLGAALQIVLDRRIGEHLLPDSVRVIAAGNGKTDKGTNRMPMALANRFAHFEVEPDVQAWLAWAERSAIDPLLMAFVGFRGDGRDGVLWRAPADGEKAFPTPRQWSRYNRVMTQPDEIRSAIGQGLVGIGAGGEAEAFIRMAKGLPSIADILANPTSAPVPSDPGMLYAVAGAVARKADIGNMTNVVSYLDRLPKEFAIMAVRSASNRDPKVKETAAYGAFKIANQDVEL